MQSENNLGKSFIYAIIQIAFYLFSYEIINSLFRKFYGGYRRDIAWGMSAQYYFIWFAGLVLVTKILKAFISIKKAALIFDILAIIVFSYVIYESGI